MKIIAVLFLLLVTLFAQEAKQKLTLGLGAYVQTQPYSSVSPIIVPTPVVFFDNSLFYIRWSRAGLYFLGDKSDDFSWGLSLTAQPRAYGYQASDATELNNLDDKDATFEGGIAFSASSEDKYIEIMALTDLLGRYESWLVKAEFGDKYTLEKITFYPSIIVSYQSDDFMNYYYGISQKEASKTAYNAYDAEAGFQIGVQTYIKRPLTENLSCLLNIRADMLPKSAQESPIIDNNFIYSGMASLIYTFEY